MTGNVEKSIRTDPCEISGYSKDNAYLGKLKLAAIRLDITRDFEHIIGNVIANFLVSIENISSSILLCSLQKKKKTQSSSDFSSVVYTNKGNFKICNWHLNIWPIRNRNSFVNWQNC